MSSLAPDLEHVLRHTRALWEGARGKRIFVTGGTGFFGRWLLESFAHVNRALNLQAHMTVLSRNPEAFLARAPHLANECEFVRGDVRHLQPSRAARFDFMIHAATEASAKLNDENPRLMFETIVEGTRAALEFAVATGARRFLLTSSGAVYGPQPSELTHIPEEYFDAPDAAKPDSAYGEGKRQAEMLCAAFHQEHGLQPLIARCFAFVGPFLPLDAHFAIGNFIRDAIAGGPIRVGGDGTPFRSYLYASDLMVWLWTILFKGEAMRPYNVGSAHDLTIAQLAETVRKVIDPKLTIEVAKKAPCDARLSRYVPANARARTELHLSERVKFEDAIGRTADHAKHA